MAHAALVFDGDVAVGWCEYGTPEELPSIYHRAQYEKEQDLVPDYRLTCFFIDRDHRRQGVSAAALRGALDLIAQAGRGVVERATRGIPRARRSRRRSSTTAPAACSRRRGRLGNRTVCGDHPRLSRRSPMGRGRGHRAVPEHGAVRRSIPCRAVGHPGTR
jgi:GNAT superfamily N-acetyltransferase